MLYRIMAGVIMALFYGCYFLKMWFQRRKGIRTDQMGRGKKGLARLVELSLKCSANLIGLVQLGSILMDANGAPDWLRILGCIVGLGGAVVFAIGATRMGDSWRAGVSEEEQTELVTSGIFCYSRNPAFLGFDLMYLGMSCLYFNLPLAALSLVGAVLLHLQIVYVEEPYLRKAFGEAYRNYEAQVGRYLGRHLEK